MRTVLVVDDEFGIVEVLEAILTAAGFHVVVVTTGRQALARIDERGPTWYCWTT